MHKLAMACLFGVGALTGSANANEHSWYAGAEFGPELSGTFNPSSEDGWAAFATIGRRLGSNFRLEGELGYRTTNDDYYDTGQISVMVNALYDVPLTETLTLSLGAGAGIDRIHVEEHGWVFFSAFDDTDIQGAAQLIAGLHLEVGDSTDLSFNFRYMRTAENDWIAIENNAVTLGVRFAF